MALRGNKIENKNDGIPSDLYFEASADTVGFDIEAYRKANKVNIFLKPGKSKVINLFSAYYKGNLGFSCELDRGDYGETVREKLNNLFGDSWRSLISSIGESVTGQSWSGAFDAPLKPYIRGTKPLTFEIPCYLPLIQKGDGTDTYEKNIETPLNDLITVAMPTKNKTVSGAIDSARQSILDMIDGIFQEAEATGTYWEFVQNATHDYIDNFFGGIYLLNNPIQYDANNKIIIRIGPWRIDDVIIDKVAVEYTPLIYNDGSTVYPACAKATISFTSKYKMTPDILNVGNNVSDKVMQLVPDGATFKPEGNAMLDYKVKH